MVALARQVTDFEAPRERALLEAKESRVRDFVKGAVAEDLLEWLVVGDDYEIVTTLREIPRLL